MSRRWTNGVDHWMKFTTGSMFGHDAGPITAAVIWKPLTVRDSGLFRVWDSSDNVVMTMNPYSDGLIYGAIGGTRTRPYTASDGWRLDCLSKEDADTVDPTPMFWHEYFYNTDTWSHIDTGGDMGDSTFGTFDDEIEVGGFTQTGEILNGEIAVMGFWKVMLSDAQIEGLTTELSAWMDLDPDILWAFNQDDVTDPVLDLTGGGADEFYRVGTTVGASDPPGFNYSLSADTRFHRQGGVWVPVTRHVRQGGAWVAV